MNKVDVKYVFDGGGTTTIVVTYNDISYTYDGFSHKNAKEVDKMLSKMIKIERNDNPSQKDLASLLELLDNLKDSSFKLQGKNIVAIDEKDSDLEL